MLLGIPFHLSLIYSSHAWAVNSASPSFSLTVLNDFIHAFRMQVFFVISGYFSYMLYEALRAPPVAEGQAGAGGNPAVELHPANYGAAVFHAEIFHR